MRRGVRQTTHFVRAAKRHLRKHPDAAATLTTVLELMAEDVYAPSLRTHRLKGALGDVWACTTGYDVRILFDLEPAADAGEDIVLLTIGTDDDVYR